MVFCLADKNNRKSVSSATFVDYTGKDMSCDEEARNSHTIVAPASEVSNV